MGTVMDIGRALWETGTEEASKTSHHHVASSGGYTLKGCEMFIITHHSSVKAGELWFEVDGQKVLAPEEGTQLHTVYAYNAKMCHFGLLVEGVEDFVVADAAFRFVLLHVLPGKFGYCDVVLICGNDRNEILNNYSVCLGSNRKWKIFESQQPKKQPLTVLQEIVQEVVKKPFKITSMKKIGQIEDTDKMYKDYYNCRRFLQLLETHPKFDYKIPTECMKLYVSQGIIQYYCRVVKGEVSLENSTEVKEHLKNMCQVM